MAISFDPINKVIQLDSFQVSEKEIWKAYVDWSVEDDNLKYGVGMTQLGGQVPVALYIFLDLGWKIRPKEEDGITTITGNISSVDNSSPITSTLGNWQSLVNMETPVKAVAIETLSSGLTPEESSLLKLIVGLL
jgi:hypothetical protein